ncbi:DUF4139 domain-containing protein, partial [bacterium]|nr:DUF4139 domain-containing protein [bacterium]
SETAQFKAVSSSSELIVLEQNLEFDLLSPAKMLEKYLGKSVSIIRTHPTNGSETSESAEVLAVANGVVLKTKDRIETGVPGRLSFSEVPANLRAEPTLSLLVESKKRGEREVELNYLSDGITWKADYIAELNSDEDSTQLTGLVTLTNQSGTSFRNAQLQLMGGDIQTVDRGPYRTKAMSRSAEMPMAYMAEADAASANMSSDAFFEYHLYTLPRSTSVMSNQTKQVTMLQAADVDSRKELVFTSAGQNYYNDPSGSFSEEGAEVEASPDDAELGAPVGGGVFLVFENDKKSRLGMPMPAGTVRVYKKDKNNMSQFLGEDAIRHIPEGERVRVRLGSSFDVTARRKRTSFKNVPVTGGLKKVVRSTESGVRVTFKNAKNSAQKVIYREVIPGEWKILSSNTEYKKVSKDNVEWQISVPAKGKLSLDYKVQVSLSR